MTDVVQVISEDDLLKSIQELEDRTGAPPKPAALPSTEKVKLAKSTATTLREGANPSTRRALDVSEVLSDLVNLIGKHNDDALETLMKSVNSGAERDLAIVKVLSDLRKSVDGLAEKVEKWGTEPRRPRSATTTDVLHKGIKPGETPGSTVQLDPRTARRQITQGLEILAKSLSPSDPKFQDIAQAAIRFEATGQIEDRYIAAAQKALQAPAA